MCVIDDKTKATLIPIIKERIYPGAIVKSDEWSSYWCLGKEGFEHLTVNHKLSFVTLDGVHTQLVESLWSQVKSIIKVKRGTNGGMLQGYLDYYSFHRLACFRKLSPIDLFFGTVIQVGNFY